MQAANPWIAFRRAQPAPSLRIFCFPHAGGSASVYRGWQEELGPKIEVCPIQLPGHETRLREPLLRDMDAVADGATEAILPLLDLPFVLFGHSMGSLAAFEVALRLRDRFHREPVAIFASARRAPRIAPDRSLHNLDPQAFRTRLRELDGTPTEVLNHPELMDMVEPILRADFEMNETYAADRNLSGVVPLNCPVHVYFGIDDQELGPRENLTAWEEISHGPFKVREFQGGHFYLTERPDEVLRALQDDLS